LGLPQSELRDSIAAEKYAAKIKGGAPKHGERYCNQACNEALSLARTCRV
jgi:hypothetical protein